MILSDSQLLEAGEDLISPFKPENVQPASIDLTLSNHFLRVVGRTFHSVIDLADVARTAPKYEEVTEANPWIGPGEFLLGSTAETIKVPSSLVGRVEGKSSLGRLGLMVHSTAGFIDPGFEGTITLEFYNLNSHAIVLCPGLRICQISFTELTSPAAKPYGHADLGSKYQGQTETTASRYKG